MSRLRKHISSAHQQEPRINQCFWQLPAGGDPATQLYSWARVKDIKLTVNSGQHAEQMERCSRMMTKAEHWNCPRIWGELKISIIQYWCGTNAIISCWVPAKGHQTNNSTNRTAFVCSLTLRWTRMTSQDHSTGQALSPFLSTWLAWAPWETPASSESGKQRGDRFRGAAPSCLL